MTAHVAVGFMLCAVIGSCLAVAWWGVYARLDDHGEQLANLQIIVAGWLPEELDEVEPEPAASWYEDFKAQWQREHEGRAVVEVIDLDEVYGGLSEMDKAAEPTTQPIEISPPTVPSEAVIEDEWERVQREDYERWMARYTDEREAS